jgi:signal recognition particle subunit SRP54
MGDIVTLVEKVQAEVDEKRARMLEEKIRTRSLTLEDFLQQLQQLKKMGNIQDMLGLLPGMGGMDFSSAQEEIPRVEAIIRSMTPEERNNPEIVDSSRRRRIAAGSGSNSQEINHLLKQFRQMIKLMKRFREAGKGPKGFGFPPGARSGVPRLGHRRPMTGHSGH